MDHPSVEIRFPFDGGNYRFGVPSDTTHFYWGAIGIGTLNDPISSLQKEESISQSALLRTTRDQISCSVTLDDNPEPLLQEIRRRNGQRQHAFWKAVELDALPITAMVTLTTAGEPPSINGKPAALWTHDDKVIPWNETVQSKLRLVPVEGTFKMSSDGLWGRHDVYTPKVLRKGTPQ